MLVPTNAIINNMQIGVFILQCLQNEVITAKEARDMMFINDIQVMK